MDFESSKFSHQQILVLAEIGELIEAAKEYKRAAERTLESKDDEINEFPPLNRFGLLLKHGRPPAKDVVDFDRVANRVSTQTILTAKKMTVYVEPSRNTRSGEMHFSPW